MHRYLFTMYVLLLISIVATPIYADTVEKSDNKKPAWLKNTPKALNGSYSFKVVVVDNGQTLSSSRLLARTELTRYIQKEFNIQVSEDLSNQSETKQQNDKCQV